MQVREAVARQISLMKASPETGQEEPGAWWWHKRSDRAQPHHFEGECRQEDLKHADDLLAWMAQAFASGAVLERIAEAVYNEDDPWSIAFPWPGNKDSSPEGYRRAALAAVKEMFDGAKVS